MKHKGKKMNLRMTMLTPVVIILLSLVISSVLMIATGANPIHAYSQLFIGAFGSKAGWIATINKAVPICFAGFAVALAKKAGIFNIGVEGQLVMGAFGSTIAGIYLEGLPAVVHVPLALGAGMLFGALYAMLPTWLYVKRNANLLVVFIMMNSIAKLLLTYLVVKPFAGDNKMITATNEIQKSAMLPYLIERPARLSTGIMIVAIAAVLLWIFMNKTVFGYELQRCGNSREAAEYAGIRVRRYLAGSLLAGGALGGLAGAVEILGSYHRLYDGFSPGYGFDGIPIALLVNGNPAGVILGSVLFGALRVGANTMQAKAGVSSEIVSVIQGTLVCAIACEAVIRFELGKKKRKEAAPT